MINMFHIWIVVLNKSVSTGFELASQMLDILLYIDLDENRLRVAKEMGATYTVKVTTRDSRELARQIEGTLGCKPDRTIECSGAEPSIATAIYVSTMLQNFA